jgi:hypothetical protein
LNKQLSIIKFTLSILRGLHPRRSVGTGVAHLRDLLLRWLQDLEGADQVLVHAHQGTGIVELSAVIGRREDGNQLSLREELVAFLHHLVRSAN